MAKTTQKSHKSIKESVEFSQMLGGLARRFVEGFRDGKLSLFEAAGFFAEVGTIKTGVSGAAEIPAELADLDETERDELLALIKLELSKIDGISAKVEDAAEIVLKWILATVRMAVDVSEVLKINVAQPA